MGEELGGGGGGELRDWKCLWPPVPGSAVSGEGKRELPEEGHFQDNLIEVKRNKLKGNNYEL